MLHNKPLLNSVTHFNKHQLSCSWVCESAEFCWSRLGLAVGFRAWVTLDWRLSGLGSRLWVQFRPFHKYYTEAQTGRVTTTRTRYVGRPPKYNGNKTTRTSTFQVVHSLILVTAHRQSKCEGQAQSQVVDKFTQCTISHGRIFNSIQVSEELGPIV